MPNLSIYTSPAGSQLTSAIDTTTNPPEPASKNDFPIYITGDGNFTLEQSDIGLTADYSIQGFEGDGCTYRAMIRPPETAGVLTVSIAENAVPEMNPAVSEDIRVSTAYPDADAVTPTLLVNPTQSISGIAVRPTDILAIVAGTGIQRFRHDGTDTGDTLITRNFRADQNIDFINGDILSSGHSAGSFTRQRLADSDFIFTFASTENFGKTDGITHTRLGYADAGGIGIRILPYNYENESDFTEYAADAYEMLTHQDNVLYLGRNSGSRNIGYAEILDNGSVEFRRPLNINTADGLTAVDLSIYRDTMYFAKGGDGIFTLDIRPYRPLAKNTKTTVYPVFATNGDTIPLKQYCPDGKDFIFSVGFDKPDYLSINASNEIAIANDAVTETTPVLVTVTGINYIDSVDFSFYIIIEPATAPVWRDVDTLSMKPNTTYNLHQIVDAESITQQSGPTGSSTSDGIFRLGAVGGDVTFRATKDGLTADKTIQIDLIQEPLPANYSDIFRYRYEIAGIDVTDDLLKSAPFQLSKSTDDVEPTKYRADSVRLSLSNIGDKYDPEVAGNFWETNNLNMGGYQEELTIYMENLISGVWVSQLRFRGVIQTHAEVVSAVQVNLMALDVSVVLERSAIDDFGNLVKWDTLRKLSDEDNFEGVYVPEGSLVPMQPRTAEAYHDRTKLTRSNLQLPTHGPALLDTMYASAADIRVSGGFFEEGLPVAKFKTYPRSSDVVNLIHALATADKVYNTEIQLPEITLSDPNVFNEGSVPFAVEETRITRLPTDWTHDTTQNRVLALLSNPEGHIADLLVSWDVTRKSYRILHTFDKGVKVHRIERQDATNYYILTSKAISQDRSAPQLPRSADATGYAYDAIAEGSEIKVYHYNASTDTLTEHVAEDDDRPCQCGIHIHAGFENKIYIDEFEGIVPYYRGAFQWYSSNLYYRYATDGEFGVARADASGTTSEMINQATLNYWNWLNFAFDIDTSNGDLYFVYAEGDADESTLTIKKRDSGGTETTILTDTQDLQDLDVLSGGGAYLGCYEAKYHSDNLYILCPVQRVNEDDSTTPSTYSRSREKSAGCVLYSCDVNAGTPELTIIEKWEFVQVAGCNLVVHDGNVHYTEQSLAASVFRAINPDL